MSLKQVCLIDSLFIETDLEKPILYEPIEPKLAHDTIIETIDIMQKSCIHKNNNPNLYIEVEKISHEHLSELIDQGWC
uniref:Uncharacterized protein n=1 Tax=Acrobeloides nanus TaxID=290746 RepID=A0A914DJ47_9BILA